MTIINSLKRGLIVGALVSLPVAGAFYGYNNPVIPEKPVLDHISEGNPIYSRYENIGLGIWGGMGYVRSEKVYYSQEEMERISREIDEGVEKGYFKRGDAILCGCGLFLVSYILALLYMGPKGKSRGESE